MSTFAQKQSISKLKHAAILILASMFVIVATLAVGKMDTFSLAVSSLLLLIFYLVVLKKEWKTLFTFVRRGLILVFSLELFLLILAVNWEVGPALPFARMLCQGAISVVLMVPAVIDSLAILLPKYNLLSNVLESFVLLRNIVGGIANDFFVGVLTAPRQSGSAGRLRHIFLSVEAIIARTPEFATNFGIASRIAVFDIHNLRFIQSSSTNVILGFVILIPYFMYFLLASS